MLVSLAFKQNTSVIAFSNSFRAAVIRLTASLTGVLTSILIRRKLVSVNRPFLHIDSATTEDNITQMAVDLLTRLLSRAGAAMPRPARRRLRAMVKRIFSRVYGEM